MTEKTLRPLFISLQKVIPIFLTRKSYLRRHFFLWQIVPAPFSPPKKTSDPSFWIGALVSWVKIKSTLFNVQLKLNCTVKIEWIWKFLVNTSSWNDSRSCEKERNKQPWIREYYEHSSQVTLIPVTFLQQYVLFEKSQSQWKQRRRKMHIRLLTLNS